MNEVEQNPRPDTRRHDLDALRATAMLLGIALHSALAYITIPFWPVRDEARSEFFDVIFTAVHGFRMPLFFVISGFFTAMLWRKRGLGVLARHRFRRIFLPLVIFVVPMWLAMWGIFVLIGATGGDSIGKIDEPSIWSAARSNDVERLNQIFEDDQKIDWNAGDPANRIPPLNWAALAGSVEATNWLLEKGANIDVRSGDQTTPLGHAAYMGRPEIARILIENGADLDAKNVYQATPLENTKADLGTTQWVADRLKLSFDEEKIKVGREEVAEKLNSSGEAHSQNGRSRLEETKMRNDRFGPITNAYLTVTDFWLFQVAPIFGHLWFLWFLCILLVPFLIYASIASANGWKGLPKGLFHFPAVLLWIVPLTAFAHWFHGILEPGGFGPDTSLTVFPFPHTVLLYAIYFFFGVLYFDADDQEGKATRYWWVSLPLGLLVCYPLGMSLIEEPEAAWLQNSIPEGLVRPLAVVLQALFAWLLIFGWMGLFRRICGRENRAIRYLSDSSYFLYLAHIPLVFLVQHFVKLVPAPAIVKFGITCAVLTGLLLLVYEFAIRYTFLGTLLNGKRVRAQKHSS
ncbi:MAG: acyltransferase family protein [Verrucomicrobiales bacterium]|jgi:fucose 4-O-acetylase-like acetyltransferase|nr:acyltransferase family protein [Verrucomicrobiales bacterium]